jgi:hypothetical protein
VSVLSFSVATIVGLVPEILMLVYMGTTMADLTSIATGDFEFGLWQKVPSSSSSSSSNTPSSLRRIQTHLFTFGRSLSLDPRNRSCWALRSA